MTALGPMRVLIVGVSTRAAAESAARAGFVVTAIDAFGDLDQEVSVNALTVPRRFTAHAAARAARTIECDAVAYLSSFENHPGAVSTLAAGRALWGNEPAVVRRVRDPLLVMRAIRRRGLAAPDAYVGPDAYVASAFRRTRGGTAKVVQAFRPAVSGGPEGPHYIRSEFLDTLHRRTSVTGIEPLSDGGEGRWLVKPLASGGGYRVRPWRHATHVPCGCYLQELVGGTPGSVVFVAAGGRAVPLGLSRQLVGEHAFGADGYRYCGNILTASGDAEFARDEVLVGAAVLLARAVVEAFGLVGVNGIDFVARDGVPYAVEVNPRWSASMELVERAYGLSVFAAHATACASGALPEFDLVRARQGAGAVGKAVVFARRDVTVGDTRAWLPGSDAGDLTGASIRDVPRPGQRIAAGQPVCTVFANGRDAATCHTALVGRAEDVYAQLARWQPNRPR